MGRKRKTPEELTEIKRAAANARWGNRTRKLPTTSQRQPPKKPAIERQDIDKDFDFGA